MMKILTQFFRIQLFLCVNSIGHCEGIVQEHKYVALNILLLDHWEIKENASPDWSTLRLKAMSFDAATIAPQIIKNTETITETLARVPKR